MPRPMATALLDAHGVAETAGPGTVRLPRRRRRRLDAAILRGTLRAVLRSRMVGRVVVVCHEGSLLAVARREGVEAVPAREGEARGGEPPPDAPLVRMAGLLPLLQAQDVAFLVGSALDGALVAATPPHRREATILVSGPSVDPPRDGLRHEVVPPPGGRWELHRTEAALEVWEGEDLERMLRSPRAAPGKALLRSWNWRGPAGGKGG